MNDLLYKILLTAVSAGVAALMRYLIPLVITQLRMAKHDLAADIIEKVVRAVEQMITEPGAGERKYETAQDILRQLLPAAGIDMTDEQIQVLIESVVQTINEEKNGRKTAKIL